MEVAIFSLLSLQVLWDLIRLRGRRDVRLGRGNQPRTTAEKRGLDKGQEGYVNCCLCSCAGFLCFI